MIVTVEVAPWIMPHGPAACDCRRRLVPPGWQEGGSWDYVLGSDQMVRDLLSRLIIGSRISVLVGISAVLIAGFLGVSMGLVAGFRSGWLDSLLIRIVDAFFAIPFIWMAMTIVGVLGPPVF